MSTNKKTLDLLAQELEKVNATLWAPKGGKGVKSKEAKEVGVVELTKIANCLASALNATKAILEDIQVDEEKKAKKMEVMEAKLAEMDMKNKEVAKQLRQVEDHADHNHQRSLKGKFFITADKGSKVIKSEKELEEEGISVAKHAAELVEMKLGVKVVKEDIKSCHHTKSGLILRFWDFKIGSVYDQVVNAVKQGKGRQLKGIYINFALTNRRASILYEVRQLVKGKMLEKYFVDSDGSISVLPMGSSDNWASVKVKLTSLRGGAAWGEGGGASHSNIVWTATPDEVRSRFSNN